MPSSTISLSAESDIESNDNDEILSLPSGVEDNTESEERGQIREDLKAMTFKEMLHLKEELGAKMYNEVMYDIDESTDCKNKNRQKLEVVDFKRLNKNRPREASAKRQVPFLGTELREKKFEGKTVRDPRFEESAGIYDPKQFKKNYKFITKIRQKEVTDLKKQLTHTEDATKKVNIRRAIQRLANKNIEDFKWHTNQVLLKQEKLEMQKFRTEGKQPHYLTKKERRAKELVMKFEHLKKTGKLNKHLEKRRKKNIVKDRNVINII